MRWDEQDTMPVKQRLTSWEFWWNHVLLMWEDKNHNVCEGWFSKYYVNKDWYFLCEPIFSNITNIWYMLCVWIHKWLTIKKKPAQSGPCNSLTHFLIPCSQWSSEKPVSWRLLWMFITHFSMSHKPSQRVFLTVLNTVGSCVHLKVSMFSRNSYRWAVIPSYNVIYICLSP